MISHNKLGGRCRCRRRRSSPAVAAGADAPLQARSYGVRALHEQDRRRTGLQVGAVVGDRRQAGAAPRRSVSLASQTFDLMEENGLRCEQGGGYNDRCLLRQPQVHAAYQAG